MIDLLSVDEAFSFLANITLFKKNKTIKIKAILFSCLKVENLWQEKSLPDNYREGFAIRVPKFIPSPLPANTRQFVPHWLLHLCASYRQQSTGLRYSSEIHRGVYAPQIPHLFHGHL